MFCGVTNHASLFGSLMCEAGFGGCQENFYQDIFRPFLFQHDFTPVHKAVSIKMIK